VGQTLQESDVTFAETAIVITVYCLPTKENKILFSVASKGKFAVSVFRLQQMNGNCHFPLVLFSLCGILETWRHGNMET
jgi:hypothetical protein